MKISTNSVGNYNPHQIKKLNPSTNSKEPKTVTSDIQITKEEKEFFSKLYPEKREAIIDYHFYERSGSMSGVSVGSLLDKRG